MWHTSAGDRTLQGAEARLFADALWDFVEEIELDEGEYEVGLDVFDRLTYGQKASLLSTVGNGLLKPEVPIHDLTSAVECTVAAVFQFLKTEVIVEIDESLSETTWRKSILAARREVDAEDLPAEDCKGVEDWFLEIEELEDMILWDNDYLSETEFVDDSPEDSNYLNEKVGVNESYFNDIAEDPRPNEIKKIVTEIKNLCRSICG